MSDNSQDRLQEYLDFAIQLAKDAGALIKAAVDSRMAGSGSNIELKKENPTDLVTETDKAVEEFIKERLYKTYPEHKFIGEETFASGAKTEFTNDPTWIVDPIDGTTNFIHGYPFVAVSIGLTLNKIPTIGVVFNPLLNELYSAARGQGAYLNQTQRLPLFHPPQPLTDLSHCLIATEAGSDRSKQVIDAKIAAIHDMLRKRSKESPYAAEAHSIRTTGSAALNLCNVAKGIIDVYWEVGCWEWDVAAAIVIVQESGGIVIEGDNDKLNNEPVNIFCRKYLAIRAASDNKSQLEIASQMKNLIPNISAPRPPVPGGYSY
ncbi:inositol monophosphatase [Cokeromyces recurvatus]|uniref:inositol monophosphatase n=1 Tax=Cokeromyces recurvatus TaxID=90255 RepID=UPI002220878B|nr:inositol monophosphatase [Cokeromyces recurvatus]KAI7902500.1 inositol monophosphatase [Cokeromyces recurvatus]